MSKRIADKRRLFPLQLTIGTLFISLITVLGVVLGLYNFQKTSEILYKGVNQLFKQAGQEISSTFNANGAAISQIVRFLANSAVAVGHDSLPDWRPSLPLFAATLRSVPELAGLQIAYGNGDYLIIRPMEDPLLRGRFRAPAEAVFNVDSFVSVGNGWRWLTRRWLDADLREIGHEYPVFTSFDPRQNSWYTDALATNAEVRSGPHFLDFIRKVGVTVSLKAPGNGTVVGAFLILDRFSEMLASHPLAASGEIVLLRMDGKVTAYTDPNKLIVRQRGDIFEMATLSDLDDGVLKYFAGLKLDDNEALTFNYAGQPWFGLRQRLDLEGWNEAVLLMLMPKRVLLRDAVRGQFYTALISLGIIGIAILASWMVSKKISRPIVKLAEEANRVGRFDFHQDDVDDSHIKEVHDLVTAMGLMKRTINRFLTLIESLAGIQDVDKLLADVSRETMDACLADGVFIYLVDQQERVLKPGAAFAAGGQERNLALLPVFPLQDDNILAQALQEEGSSIFHLRADDGARLTSLLAPFDHQRLFALTLPLTDRRRQKVGILCLLYDTESREELSAKTDQLAFVRALSGFAAVSLESRQLLRMQKELFDALIKLLAGAIDVKSRYTAGHCQRVPVLTGMLAARACASSRPPFAEFNLSPDEWEELHVASWLHDCGKITTPEYVVDKATKLETIYNRIHEIRTRFEILKRDAHILFLERVAAGEERQLEKQRFEEQLRQLDEEFAFVAGCNIGGETMDQEQILRLRAIGNRTWLRTLDDRLGISEEEILRKSVVPATGLPVPERLLDDKKEHLVERPAEERIAPDNPHGFKLRAPLYKFNFGELHNLSVATGTLTEEERYLIKEHMVQTIVMLNRLPYPPHLARVPIIAGGHHEHLDGTGYPKMLSAAEQDLPARIMAIADIFEALTASDRPYKKGKTLSETVQLMNDMVRENHIDADLFQLFLREGIHLEYARQYLRPEQIDMA